MSDQETARDKRLREALRENLKRRKSQARGRAGTAQVEPGADDAPDETEAAADRRKAGR